MFQMQDNNIIKIAKTIIEIYDNKENKYFRIHLNKNYEWTRKYEGTKKINPYIFTNYESDTTLQNAKIKLLVKTLRFYFMESVKRINNNAIILENIKTQPNYKKILNDIKIGYLNICKLSENLIEFE
jgi:hypothetical protein